MICKEKRLYCIYTIFFRFCESCGHLGALLYVASDIVASGEAKAAGDPTCTDLPCYWSDPKGITPKIQIIIDPIGNY